MEKLENIKLVESAEKQEFKPNTQDIINKINEIIDYVEKLESKLLG